MTNWLIYPSIVATAISVSSLTFIAAKYHDNRLPPTLSELAAAEEHLLLHFRTTLWICGTLFAITVYGFVVSRVAHPAPIFAAWTLTYAGNLLLAVVPARGSTLRTHTWLAQLMAVGMLALAYLLGLSLSGMVKRLELIIAVMMTVMGLMTIVHKRHFIIYELPFIYLSHLSIVMAALAIR